MQLAVKVIAIGAKGLEFDSLASPFGNSIAKGSPFLCSSVAPALNRGDGPRHSLHALAKYRKYYEDLICLVCGCL